jgi:Leucine-rich repeat (LRR) protein
MQSRLASEIALFGGAEFNDPTSIQSRALAFLESLDNTLLVFNTTQLTQLYALSCFYFSTYNVFNGYDQSAWLDHQHWVQTDNVCNWFGVKCSPGEKVTSLQLPNNNVTGIVPLEMGLLTDLELLDLSNNAVANLNEEMAWMAQLTNLRKYC